MRTGAPRGADNRLRREQSLTGAQPAMRALIFNEFARLLLENVVDRRCGDLSGIGACGDRYFVFSLKN